MIQLPKIVSKFPLINMVIFFVCLERRKINKLKGCCVMQRCLDFASKKQKNDLVRVIASQTLDLVEDQYGNYVVFIFIFLDRFKKLGSIHFGHERKRIRY